jgi:hypothetical protein
VKLAAERFGYQVHQVEMRLYVGKFAGAKTGEHRKGIETWCAEQQVGADRSGSARSPDKQYRDSRRW